MQAQTNKVSTDNSVLGLFCEDGQQRKIFKNQLCGKSSTNQDHYSAYRVDTQQRNSIDQ